jgi:hypothetical protein
MIQKYAIFTFKNLWPLLKNGFDTKGIIQKYFFMTNFEISFNIHLNIIILSRMLFKNLIFFEMHINLLKKNSFKKQQKTMI